MGGGWPSRCAAPAWHAAGRRCAPAGPKMYLTSHLQPCLSTSIDERLTALQQRSNGRTLDAWPLQLPSRPIQGDQQAPQWVQGSVRACWPGGRHRGSFRRSAALPAAVAVAAADSLAPSLPVEHGGAAAGRKTNQEEAPLKQHRTALYSAG